MTAKCVVMCTALALGACAGRPAPPPASGPPNVLIVTVDTLRADRLGIYGARNVATPNMDRLAREGVWAPQADVHVPLTRPSHISLFTGRYPDEHGIRDNVAPPLAPGVPLLSERFKNAGYATAAFVASVVLEHQSGLARGFDRYSDTLPPGADRRSGDEVVAEAIAWIRERGAPKPEAKAGFFAWVHLYDPHAPYVPPGRYATEYAGRPYDGTVAWCDELVGRLVDALRQAGTLDNTLIVLTSDHGEALGEHGEDVHGYFVYEATMRVPLIMRGPGVKAGAQIAGVARTVDLFPTIVELAHLGGAATPTSGRTLVPALTGLDSATSAASLTAGGTALADAASFGESLMPLLQYGWSDLRSVRDGRWKYILAPKPELYDLDRDPGEQHNLVDGEPAKARALRGSIEARLKTEQSAARSESAAAGIPPELLERLGALGYVGPGRPVSPKSSGSGGTKAEDPKDKLADYLAIRDLMQQGLVAMRSSRPADAVAPLQAVARRGVDSFELHYYLARTFTSLQRWREAAAEYDKAVARLPGHAEAWRLLGQARVELHDTTGAIRAFEKLVALAPRDPIALMQLGEAYRDAARNQDAVRVIREALAIDPKPAQYWNSFGTVLGMSGQMAEAERAFAEAGTREPGNGLYAYNHGLALHQLGRRDEAVAEMRRAATLGYSPGR
jgi:choline-sulfatase